MITYAVCLHRPDVYERVCLPALRQQEAVHGAEILTVTSDKGITYAYEQARQQASHDTVVYLHDDLELLDEDATPRILRLLEESGADLLGVVGSAAGQDAIPWWRAQRFVGAWVRPTAACGDKLIFSGGDVLHERRWDGHSRGHRKPWAPAGLLDGIFLADRSRLPWLPREGWHGYDAERCFQLAEAGGRVVVGDVLVRHHNQAHGQAWHAAMEPTWERLRAMYQRKEAFA